MIAFFLKRIPLSYNARHNNLAGYRRYLAGVASTFQSQGFSDIPFDRPLYSRVIYFHSIPVTVDADNISKPIHDALNGIAYRDDNLVKSRSSAVVDIVDLNSIDMRFMPDNAFEELVTYFEIESHLVYIEIGNFSFKHIRIGEE